MFVRNHAWRPEGNLRKTDLQCTFVLYMYIIWHIEKLIADPLHKSCRGLYDNLNLTKCMHCTEIIRNQRNMVGLYLSNANFKSTAGLPKSSKRSIHMTYVPNPEHSWSTAGLTEIMPVGPTIRIDFLNGCIV